MNKASLLLIISLILAGSSSNSFAQPYANNWTEISAYGDTIYHAWPPPDSTFSQNRILIKFRPNVLKYDSLCYNCDTIVSGGLTSDSATYFPKCKETLMIQQFTTSIVTDVPIRGYLNSRGVLHLKRLTPAHPRKDTLTLARNGDTLRMNHFDYMVAYLNNDTSVLTLLSDLYFLDSSGVEYAEPVYFGKFARNPGDPWYAVTGAQKSIMPNQVGMPVA